MVLTPHCAVIGFFSLDMESKVRLSKPYLFSFLINSFFSHAAPFRPQMRWCLIKDVWRCGLFFTLCPPCIFHLSSELHCSRTYVGYVGWGWDVKPSRSICLFQHQPWDSITSNPANSPFYWNATGTVYLLFGAKCIQMAIIFSFWSTEVISWYY